MQKCVIKRENVLNPTQKYAIQRKTCYQTQKRVIPTWNHNLSNKKNVLSNAETCYPVRKCVIKRKNVLSNEKTCYPTRKCAIQHLFNAKNVLFKTKTCYPILKCAIPTWNIISNKKTWYPMRKYAIQRKKCYPTRKHTIPTWKHNIQQEKRVIQCGNIYPVRKCVIKCENVLSNPKICYSTQKTCYSRQKIVIQC